MKLVKLRTFLIIQALVGETDDLWLNEINNLGLNCSDCAQNLTAATPYVERKYQTIESYVSTGLEVDLGKIFLAFDDEGGAVSSSARFQKYACQFEIRSERSTIKQMSV